MSGDLSPIDTAKSAAAKRAVEYVEDGMLVGLGTGTTAAWMVRHLGERVRNDGLDFIGVPTSIRTADLAQKAGLKVIGFDEAKRLDLAIDGTDEVDLDLNLIKGGGGALLREKIVAMASDRMIVITDESKCVERLGAFPLSVEIIPFGWQATRELIEMIIPGDELPEDAMMRRMKGDDPFTTDEGNYILDLHLLRIGNARQLSSAINHLPGVVENGLFIDICDVLVVGREDGRVEVIDRDSGTGRGTGSNEAGNLNSAPRE